MLIIFSVLEGGREEPGGRRGRVGEGGDVGVDLSVCRPGHSSIVTHSLREKPTCSTPSAPPTATLAAAAAAAATPI